MKRLNLNLKSEDWVMLKDLAKREDRTMTSVVIRALRAYSEGAEPLERNAMRSMKTSIPTFDHLHQELKSKN